MNLKQSTDWRLNTLSDVPAKLSSLNWGEAYPFTWNELFTDETIWGGSQLGKVYLIQDDDKLYTVNNGVAIEIDAPLQASTFVEYGFNEIPSATLLRTFTRPKLMYWIADETANPHLKANMGAIPYPQQIISKIIYTDDPTILGMESVSCEYDGEPLIAISFAGDDYKYYNNGEWIASEDSGMSVQTFLDIPMSEWNTFIAQDYSIQVKIILTSPDDEFYKIIFEFENED